PHSIKEPLFCVHPTVEIAGFLRPSWVKRGIKQGRIAPLWIFFLRNHSAIFPAAIAEGEDVLVCSHPALVHHHPHQLITNLYPRPLSDFRDLLAVGSQRRQGASEWRAVPSRCSWRKRRPMRSVGRL